MSTQPPGYDPPSAPGQSAHGAGQYDEYRPQSGGYQQPPATWQWQPPGGSVDRGWQQPAGQQWRQPAEQWQPNPGSSQWPPPGQQQWPTPTRPSGAGNAPKAHRQSLLARLGKNTKLSLGLIGGGLLLLLIGYSAGHDRFDSNPWIFTLWLSIVVVILATAAAAAAVLVDHKLARPGGIMAIFLLQGWFPGLGFLTWLGAALHLSFLVGKTQVDFTKPWSVHSVAWAVGGLALFAGAVWGRQGEPSPLDARAGDTRGLNPADSSFAPRGYSTPSQQPAYQPPAQPSYPLQGQPSFLPSQQHYSAEAQPTAPAAPYPAQADAQAHAQQPQPGQSGWSQPAHASHSEPSSPATRHRAPDDDDDLEERTIRRDDLPRES